MSNQLQGKTALITGSTSNIGRAIAERFAAEGAHVIVSGRDQARGGDVVAGIRDKGGRADFIRADLDGRPAASQALASAAIAALDGRLDILVNNAGIFPPVTTLTADEETFDRVYGVNVKAPFFLTQALAPVMAEHGGGTIINLGSWVARLGLPGHPDAIAAALYLASDEAEFVHGAVLDVDGGRTGVAVNAAA